MAAGPQQGATREVRILDAATGQERATRPGHRDWVEAVAIAPDGRWLPLSAKTGRCGSGRRTPTAMVRRCRSGTRPPGRNGSYWPATSARCSRWRSHRHGRWFASGGEDGTVRIWDAVTDGDGEAVQVGDVATWQGRSYWLRLRQGVARRSHRTADGSPAAAKTGRCGSGRGHDGDGETVQVGTRRPGRNGSHSLPTPAGRSR